MEPIIAIMAIALVWGVWYSMRQNRRARALEPRLLHPHLPASTSYLTEFAQNRLIALRRDGHCCTAPGCGESRVVDVHHKIPRALGGSNHPDNLVTLCPTHHAMLHRRVYTGHKN